MRYTIPQCLWRQIQSSSMLGQREARYYHVPAPVVRLLLRRRPSAILWAVGAIHVDPVQRMPRGWWVT
ncbi:hypothetical protein RZS08_55200, partial [Arthrospira platensis SPKY1]|nr:hypothetical protein [Arthrospira platensis SPKY1]